MMNRVTFYYGGHASLYFIGITVIIKYVLENCMLSIFVYIYSDLYWKYIKEDASQIYLTTNKTTKEKKDAIYGSML